MRSPDSQGPEPIHVRTYGSGPAILLVHGSGGTADGWPQQVAGLKKSYRLVVYDRRGTERSPLPPGVTDYSVTQHADDAAQVIVEQGVRPAFAVGSSFGAVIVLELARRHPGLLAGVVLCEPPLPARDDALPVPSRFMAEFERLFREEDGPAAAEYFLRTVLGDTVFDAMPPRFQEQACCLHEQIRLDANALMACPFRFTDLRNLKTPVLLLGGERSVPYFADALDALEQALPNVERRTLPKAGHMMHAQAPRALNAAVDAFCRSHSNPHYR